MRVGAVYEVRGTRYVHGYLYGEVRIILASTRTYRCTYVLALHRFGFCNHAFSTTRLCTGGRLCDSAYRVTTRCVREALPRQNALTFSPLHAQKDCWMDVDSHEQALYDQLSPRKPKRDQPDSSARLSQSAARSRIEDCPCKTQKAQYRYRVLVCVVL